MTVAVDKLVEFSEAHQKALADSSTTEAEARAKVAAFREKRDHAKATADALINMVIAAAILDDDQSLAAMVKVATMLRAELKDLGVPGVP